MASSSCSSIASTHASSLFYPKPFSELPSPFLLSFSRTLRPLRFTPAKAHSVQRRHSSSTLRATTVKAQSVDFGSSFYEDETESEDGPQLEEELEPGEELEPEEEFESEEEFDSGEGFYSGEGFGLGDGLLSLPGWGIMPVEEKEDPPCPPGLRKYETMVILRPNMTEEERLELTLRYEELLVAGGGMYVDVYNRGIIPLSYCIRKRDKDGRASTYLDGIYLVFKYFTKPESIEILETTLKTDDDVIRATSFKARRVREL